MNDTRAHPHDTLTRPILWGLAVGAVQAASPLVLRWIDPAPLHGLYLAFIAAAYVGFAVADGRPKVIAVESAIAAVFVVLASVGVTGSSWLLVIAYAGHGAKDLVQHRTQFVARTRWWPPFCATIDIVVALVLSAEIAAGVSMR